MDEKKMKTLERTEDMLYAHLDDLNDEVERSGGHILDHMVLDGVKDAVKGIKGIAKIRAMGRTDSSQATATVISVK